MDSTSPVSRRDARGALAVLLFFALTACGRSSRVAPPPAPIPPAVAASEALPPTLDEAKAVRNAGKSEIYERALRALALSSDPITSRRAKALLALHFADTKRYGEALPALISAAASDPPIAPYLQLRIIDAAEATGRTADAIATAMSIVANAPESSAATIARIHLPALYAAIRDEANMDAWLTALTAIPIDALTEADFVALARALETCGRTDRATDIRMRILRDDPDGRFIEPVYAAVKSTAPSPLDALTTEEGTQLAAGLARADRYDQSLDLLERIGIRSDAAANALYRTVRLRALFNSRNYTKLLQETKDTTLDAPLLLLRARAAWRDDEPQEFLAGLDRIEKQFPKSREAVEAKVLRAKYYATDVIDYEKSIANLSAAIDAGATGSDGENLWTLGWTNSLAGKYDDALRTFDRYIREYPDGDYKTNALFWTGKIHDRLSHPAERDAAFNQLIAEYPYNYYSYRARQMEPRLQPGVTPAEASAPFPDVDGELARITDPQLEAVRELVAVDLTRDATREMKTLAATYPDNAGIAFMLADVYSMGGEPLQAISILQRRFRAFVRHGGSGIPPRFWQILYPLNYWEAIRSEARKRDLDPFLVASIIRQESGFEPAVVSNAGAVGLMQIMPYEAARIGARAGIDGLTRQQLFDPLTNIAVGAAEFSQKLANMSGNHILAIAAYNAGEEAVGRWIAQTSFADVGGDPDRFVDSIPYAETRLYVKSVMRNRFEYRRVYEGSTAVSEKNDLTDGHSHH